MPIPVGEAFSAQAAPAAPAAQPPGLSVDSLYPAQAPVSGPGVGATAKSLVTGQSKWWTDYKKLANQYSEALKEDFTASPQTPAGALLQSGKTVLDLIGAAFSPLESVARTGVIDPVQAAVSKLGSLVESHVAADEEWTPQERREAHLAGRTLGQKYPKAIDWKVHRADVQRTVQDLNKFIETGVLTGVGMVGGKRPLATAKLSSRELEAIRLEREAKAAQESSIIPEKPRVQVTGVDPATGKLRVRVVSPEQASAGVASAMRDAHIEASPMVKVGPKASVEVEQFARDWNTLHSEMLPRYESAMQSGRPIGAHVLLDTMLESVDETLAQTARGSNYQGEFIRRLRQFVDDVPVSFVPVIRTPEGAVMEKTAGVYRPSTRSVEIVVSPLSTSVATHAVLHELTHAATLDWIRANPAHELVNELEELFSIAKKNIHDSHYGLTNTEEFVAEAMTSPRFQKALLGVKAQGMNIFSRLADVLRRVFGLPESEIGFMHRVMRTSDAIMVAQAASRRAQSKLLGMDPVTGKIARPAELSLPKIARPVVERLKGYVDEAIRAVNPEALGEKARAAASVIARGVADNLRRQAVWHSASKDRTAFWQSNQRLSTDFIRRFEKGQPQPTRELQSLAGFYKLWAREIYNQDTNITGLSYTPQDNYLYHAFEDSQAVADFFTQRYGKKWGNPTFIKDRGFALYEEAVAAGFKPLYRNPEEIMLARQHASDIAEMREGIMKELERYGLATLKKKGQKPPAGSTPRRAPSGQWYNIGNQAQAILHNAFDTPSLWSMKGVGGDVFRGWMAIKNRIVPARLGLSAFHGLHVLHIDNAAATSRAYEEMLAGHRSAGSMLLEAGKSFLLYKSLYENPKLGGRLLKVWKGQVPVQDLTGYDKQALQFMLEGGFIPEMSAQYRTSASESFMRAIRERAPLKAAWHLPWAILAQLQRPLMEIWIPNLKAASYIKDVQTALLLDPSLINDPLKRQLAFRRIAKSIDNRYGEMAYSTLFWKRYLKDLAVANTLSLGWNLGFIREYGGGAMDLGQFVRRTGKIQRIREGQLHRPLFLAAYTSSALAYGGLMTWALSGKFPESLTDYVFPQTGETDASGQPQRVNTMFYTREFASIYKHMEDQGVVEGLGHLVASKSSGVAGLLGEWASGVNYFGQEIRDPDASGFKKLQQTLAYTLGSLEPISLKSIQQQSGEKPVKEAVLSLAGFSPVAKYLSDTKTQAGIKSAYAKYVAPQQTPFDKAQYSEDARKLRQLLQNEDPAAQDLLEKMSARHQLSRGEQHKLMRTIKRGPPPTVRMFQRLPWQEQKKLLDKMSREEREIYLPHSNREHLRRHYEEPEK